MCEITFGRCRQSIHLGLSVLHVIVREVDGKSIVERYDVITLLHIGSGIITCSSI